LSLAPERVCDGSGNAGTAKHLLIFASTNYLAQLNSLPIYRVRTVERSKNCNDFDQEKPQPKLGNLATHTRTSHPKEWEGVEPGAEPTKPIDQGYTAASAKIMAAYLEEGKLNPAQYPTKKGFLLHFAAWILEDDLPFTTGETPGIHRLFKYLQVSYSLPSDTTVRNQLAKIYIHLHGEIVKELAVCHGCALKLWVAVVLTSNDRKSDRRSPMQLIIGRRSK